MSCRCAGASSPRVQSHSGYHAIFGHGHGRRALGVVEPLPLPRCLLLELLCDLPTHRCSGEEPGWLWFRKVGCTPGTVCHGSCRQYGSYSIPLLKESNPAIESLLEIALACPSSKWFYYNRCRRAPASLWPLCSRPRWRFRAENGTSTTFSSPSPTRYKYMCMV